MEKLIIFIICGLFIPATFSQQFDTTTKGISKGDFYSQKTSSGYEYFDSEDNLIGHSERNPDGGYTYYDAYGAQIGSIERDEEGIYTIYNDKNAEIGTLEELPSKKYRYRSSFREDINEFDVRPSEEEDIGALNPSQLFICSGY